MPEVNFPFVFFQVLNLVLLGAWLVLAVRALRQLRGADISEALKFSWAFLIVLVPVLGAIAFLSVRPGLSRTTV